MTSATGGSAPAAPGWIRTTINLLSKKNQCQLSTGFRLGPPRAKVGYDISVRTLAYAFRSHPRGI